MSSGSLRQQLAPMSIGTVFEIALRVIGRNGRALLGVALLVVGPSALLAAATSVRFSEVLTGILPADAVTAAGAATAVLTAAEVERLGGSAAVVLLASFLSGVFGLIAAAGSSAVVGADHAGRQIALVTALWACARRTWTVLGIALVTSLLTVGIIAAGLGAALAAIVLLSSGPIQAGGPGVFLALVAAVATVVAVAYLTTRWAVAVPVAALEDAGTRSALVRSWHLTGDNVLRTFAIVALAALVGAVLSGLMANLLGIVFADVLAPALGLEPVVVLTFVSAAAAVLVAPLAPVVSAVLYFDLLGRRGG